MSKTLKKMKKKLFFAYLILSIVVLGSCKKEENKIVVSPAEVEAIKNSFKVTLTATVTVDDNFQMYFSQDDYEAPYQEENSVWVPIKGSEKPQDIVFVLPEDVLPDYIRIDFGINVKQKVISIQNFKMNYFSKSFEAKDSLFFNYFIPNDCVTIVDKNKSVIQNIKSKDGRYDPLFYSEKALYDQIQLLVK